MPLHDETLINARAGEIAEAMQAGHVLVVAHPGVGTTMAIRRAFAAWWSRHNMDRATRWRLGVMYWLAGGGRYITSLSRPAVRDDFAERFPLRMPPLRMPHHTVSVAGLVGRAGALATPGEIGLAHGGVLVLDELAEFSRAAVDAVVEAMREGHITAYGSAQRIDWSGPARVIATTHPCPCGFYGHPQRACIDGDVTIARYRERVAKFAGQPNVTVLDFTGTKEQ